VTGGEFQLKQRVIFYLAFNGNLTPFLSADNFIMFSNISKRPRNDQISTQIRIHWIPIFLLLWIKGPVHEGDHLLYLVWKPKMPAVVPALHSMLFMDFMKRLDICILVSYFRHFMTVEVDSYNLRSFRFLATEVDCLVPLNCVFIIPT